MFVTYYNFEKGETISIEFTHCGTLSEIGHNSIYCPETKKVALNSSDYQQFKQATGNLSVIKLIVDRSQVVNEQYYKLMTEDDFSFLTQ